MWNRHADSQVEGQRNYLPQMGHRLTPIRKAFQLSFICENLCSTCGNIFLNGEHSEHGLGIFDRGLSGGLSIGWGGLKRMV